MVANQAVVWLSRHFHHEIIVFLIISCYPACAAAFVTQDVTSRFPVETPVKVAVQLSGFAEVANALAFRDLLQGSSLVTELKPERLSWAAGRPDLGLARWSLRLKDDARGALETELLTKAAAKEYGPLHLSVRNSSGNLIEFALAVDSAVGSDVDTDGDEAVPVDREPEESAYAEPDDVFVAPSFRFTAPIRGGRGFD